jgi:transcription initiation factor IIE alpha subunit
LTATDEFHKKKVDELIEDNPRITQRDMVAKLGILQERVGRIIAVLQNRNMGSSHADGGDESFKI